MNLSNSPKKSPKSPKKSPISPFKQASKKTTGALEETKTTPIQSDAFQALLNNSADSIEQIDTKVVDDPTFMMKYADDAMAWL